MQCRDVEQLFDAYLDRELRPENAEQLERHLDACQACGRQYRPVLEALSGAEELPVPAGLRERVLAAVLDVQLQAESSGLRYLEDHTSAPEPVRRKGVGRWLLQPSSIGALAACVVLTFSALLVWQIKPVTVLPDEGPGPRSTFLTQAFAMGQAQAIVMRGPATPAPIFAQALAINGLMQPPDETAELRRRRSMRDLPTETPPAVPEITILITGLKSLGV